MRRTYGVLALSPVIDHCFTILLAICAWILLSIAGIAIAQTGPITSSGLNTVVTTHGNILDITGGTRPGGGTNLFHSFGEFGVPTNNIANFFNAGSVDLAGNPLAAGLPTSNILGRVTDGNVSNIFGTIQTTNFGNANLFLMNPAGFLFGSNATVNVGGMVAFTSADYLKLADNTLFTAIQSSHDALLTASPVAAFGFLGPNAASIAIQGSNLEVPDGQTLSFIGGLRVFTADTGVTVPSGVTMTAGRLSAPNGLIHMETVATSGEIPLPTLSGNPLGSPVSFPGSENAVIRIQSGEFVMKGASLLTTTTGPTIGEPISIDVEAAGQFTMQNVSALSSSTTGDGRGGAINVSASTVAMDASSITSATSSQGAGGNISVRVANLKLSNGAQILSVAGGQGAAGEVDVHANNSLTLSGIDATVQVPGYLNEIGLVATGIFSDSTAGGPPGAILITSPHITVSEGGRIHSSTSSDADGAAITLTTGTLEVNSGGGILTTSGIDFQSFELRGNGKAGDVNITAFGSVSVAGLDSLGIASAIQSLPLGMGAGGSIQISTPSVYLNDQSTINTFSFGEGPAGDITLETESLAVAGGGGVTTAGSELASSGSILISVQDAVSVTGTAPDGTPSRIVNENGGSGGTGFLTITAKDLLVSDGARIRSDTFLSPQVSSDPKLVIHATDSITLAGDQSDIRVMNFLSDVGGMLLTTKTFTMTDHSTVSTLTFAEGNGGPLTITAENLSLSGGSQITSASLGGSGHAGTIQIQGPQSPADSVVIDGASSGFFTTTSSTGAGGNIEITANTVTLQNDGTLSAETSSTEATATGGSITVNATDQVIMTSGASITASSTGPGNAGNIHIDAGQNFVATNSSVTTQANQASGGTIKITTTPSGTVQLTDSKISASVLDGTGGGGSVDIDPQYVLLQNSQILAQAVQGPGGNITITITNGGLFLPDANSVISASSQFGVNGTVTIQSPNAPSSGQIQPLGKSALLATSLLNQHCAALAGGEFSSFTVAGRDSLPTEPGSWLASPLATLNAGMGLGVKAEGGRPVTRGEGSEGTTLGTSSDGETPLLSLRQIAPAGFLTQAFAVDGLTSCQS